MANSNSGNKQGKSAPKGKLIWRNPTLRASDIEWLESNYNSGPGYICEYIAGLPELWSITVRYDNYSGRFNAFVVCNDVDDPRYKIAVSVRGATAFDALYALVYLVCDRGDEIWQSPDIGDRGSRFG